MHQKLSKSPLTYVLAQIRFSSIENIAVSVPQLQDKIRAEFPIYEPININSIHFKEGKAIDTETFTQWHFIDKEKETGIILDKQTLTIHTAKYVNFEQLAEILIRTAKSFHEILDFKLTARIGLRYVNIIESDLFKMDKGLQGFQLSDDFDKESCFTKTETFQRSKAGFMKLQAIRIANKKNISGVQNFFVSPDLADIAKSLSFKNHKEPDKEFMILDIDHFSNEQKDFSIEEISQRLHELQELIYQVFCQAVGAENLNKWK